MWYRLRRDTTWYDVMCYRLKGYDMIRHDMMWCTIGWRDMIWYDMIWCDVLTIGWRDMIWYDVMFYRLRWDTTQSSGGSVSLAPTHNATSSMDHHIIQVQDALMDLVCWHTALWSDGPKPWYICTHTHIYIYICTIIQLQFKTRRDAFNHNGTGIF